MAEEQAPQLQFKPIHPIATVLNHIRLIVACGCFGTILLGTVVMLKVKPSYKSEAAFEVSLVHSRILVWDAEKQFSSRNHYMDYVRTQISYLLGEENIRATMQSIPIPNEAFQPFEDPRQNLNMFRGMFAVTPVRDTHLVSISVSSNQPKDLDLCINALMDTFLERTAEAEMGKTDTRRLYLEEELKETQAELEEKYRLLAEFTSELGTFNFLEAYNPHDQTISFLRTSLNNAFIGRVNAEHEYDAMLETATRRQGLDFDAQAQEESVRDPTVVALTSRILELKSELQQQSALLRPDHPDIVRLKNLLETTERDLAESQAQSEQRVTDIIVGKMTVDDQQELAEAQAEFNARKGAEDDIKERYDEETQRLVETTPRFLRAAQTKIQIQRLETRITNIKSRIEEIVIESKSPSRFKIQSRAVEPQFPENDKRKILLVLICGMSFMGGLFLAFAADFLDSEIVDPRYIGSLVGARPTGVFYNVNFLHDFGQLLRLAPERYISDQFRRMMPRIISAGEGTKKDTLFTVVSLSHGCGATSIALNMMWHMRNINRKAGLFEVCEGKDRVYERVADWGLKRKMFDLPEHLQKSFDLEMEYGNGLEFYHNRQSYGKEALSNEDMLKELLVEMKARNDVLIVDAPPLLKDSEAELLCKYADVVILVISGPINKSGEIKRGVALLKELGVKKCAVIANGLPLIPGGYFKKMIATYEGTERRYHMLEELLESIQKASGLSPETFNRFVRNKYVNKILGPPPETNPPKYDAPQSSS